MQALNLLICLSILQCLLFYDQIKTKQNNDMKGLEAANYAKTWCCVRNKCVWKIKTERQLSSCFLFLELPTSMKMIIRDVQDTSTCAVQGADSYKDLYYTFHLCVHWNTYTWTSAFTNQSFSLYFLLAQCPIVTHWE